MTTSAFGKGVLISIGAVGGALFGFKLQERWMQEYRDNQRDMLKEMIKQEAAKRLVELKEQESDVEIEKDESEGPDKRGRS